MKKFLVVVDIQKDFVDGSLGTKEAQEMIARAVDRIRGFDGEIFVTYDTHSPDYLQSAEGRKLPVEHCIKGTPGWELDLRIAAALKGKTVTAVEKPTFGSTSLPALLRVSAGSDDFSVELIGLCTDICVVSNALMIKAHYPEYEITVDSTCCAGVSPQTHEAALQVMRCCQINVI